MCSNYLPCFSSLRTKETSTDATLKIKLENLNKFTVKVCPRLRVKREPFLLYSRSQKRQYKSQDSKAMLLTNTNVSQRRSTRRNSRRSGLKITRWSLLKLIRFLYSKLGQLNLYQKNKYSPKGSPLARHRLRDKRHPKRMFQSLM